ncbi:MAG: hypothetical protein H0U36_02715 [Nocardioidaceae bacterium]|nr:hypothetical protein [Nocardioidaceae bacterium]
MAQSLRSPQQMLTEPAGSPLHVRALLVGACALVGAVLALPAAWIWVQVADPPSAVLSETGVFLGEVELDRLVGLTWWFLAIGLAFGVVAGLAVAWRGHRHGLATVVAALALTSVASYLTYRFGHDLFGRDVDQQVQQAQVGDRITTDMRIESLVAFLGWPVGGLVGVLAGVASWPKAPRGAPGVQ